MKIECSMLFADNLYLTHENTGIFVKLSHAGYYRCNNTLKSINSRESRINFRLINKH